MRQYFARLLAAIAVLFVGIPAMPSGTRHVSFVPWRVIAVGDEAVTAPLVLYWVPASREELRRSELLHSNALTHFSSRCVAMQVVRPDDRARIETLSLEPAELPAVVLVDANGREIARLQQERGALRVREVEELVRIELDTRSNAAEALLDTARAKAEAGDLEGAATLYREVWDQRCTCPRQGRDAQRALKKLKK